MINDLHIDALVIMPRLETASEGLRQAIPLLEQGRFIGIRVVVLPNMPKIRSLPVMINHADHVVG